MRKKLSERQLLERELDAVCREIVLDRDEMCVCPPPERGHSKIMQPGHLISRSKESVKWDLFNVNKQCSGCNLRHEYHSQYYCDWFLGEFGEGQYHRLYKDSETVRKLQIYELREMLEQMKKIRERQKREPGFEPRFSQNDILSGAWVTLADKRMASSDKADCTDSARMSQQEVSPNTSL